ncbi:hypothetical protein MUP77_23655 [Candidatus Bathyarchaeota archaeon]|nr:hypothetical protein [Candidatus Bathyarchaeota archaeon]
MAKLRCDSASEPVLGHFEWEGTPQELLAIYDGLKQRLGDTIQIGNNVPRQYDIPRHTTLHCDYPELAKKMPTVGQLVNYILSKPKFEHDIADVGLQFFGRQVKSREYGKLYRGLRAKLDMARKAIEVSQHGAFERRSTRPRNLQVYTFRSVSATPLGIQPEKTS